MIIRTDTMLRVQPTIEATSLKRRGIMSAFYFCPVTVQISNLCCIAVLNITLPAETYIGNTGGVGVVGKSKDKPKDTQQKRISQMSVAAKLNLSSLYLKMDKAVQACKL